MMFYDILEYAKPRFATFVKYGKVELAPPSPGDIAAAVPQAANLVKSAMTFKFMQLSVKVNIRNSNFGNSHFQSF